MSYMKLAAVALTVLALSGCSISQPTSGEAKSTVAPTAAASAYATIDKPWAVDFGNNTAALVTVTKVLYSTQKVNSFFPDPKNGGWVVVTITMQSTKGSVAANPLYWELRDAAGVTHNADLFGESTFASTSIAVGETGSGTIAFDAPTGASTLILTNPIMQRAAAWKITS